MKKVLTNNLRLAAFLFAALPTLVFAQKLDKTYKSVEFLEISSLTGDITIKKGTSNEVAVKGMWNDEKVSVKVDYDGKTLTIKEKKIRNNVGGNASNWVLMVPDNLDLGVNSGTGDLSISGVKADLDANSGTGDIEVRDMEGRFDLNSGTGGLDIADAKGKFDLNSGTSYVRVANSEGKFEANSGTGNVEFEKVKPTGNSTLNSGTGNVEFVLSDELAADLTLNSGTGNAVLDFDGNKIEGDFEMKCGINSGRIDAPFKFDSEQKIGNRNNGHIEKMAKIGKATYDLEISTGTGTARVKS